MAAGSGLHTLLISFFVLRYTDLGGTDPGAVGFVEMPLTLYAYRRIDTIGLFALAYCRHRALKKTGATDDTTLSNFIGHLGYASSIISFTPRRPLGSAYRAGHLAVKEFV